VTDQEDGTAVRVAGDAATPGERGHPDALDRRARDLERLANETFDLVIVGGGITGAGALLDAATRGLRVALVEQDDIAIGTSSRSSRLIHGGLRYLEQLRFGLVREALAERARLLRLAPQLVRLETFLFPLYGLPIAHRSFYAAGMLLYDLLGSARSGGFHRHLSKGGALDWAPGLRPEGLRGGILYHDAMEDDARFTIAVLRTAIAQGGLAVTRVRAEGAVNEDGRLRGVRLTDRIGGDTFVARTGAVLDATGVWAALPDRPFGSGTHSVLPSRGSHLVIPRDRIPARGGLSIKVPGKVVFMVPWPRHWVIGTTDAPYHGPVDRPAASGHEVDTILGTLNEAFTLGLTRDDVVGTYAGLRPLVAPVDAASTVRLSREHKVTTAEPGIVRVSGGKYTTYRVMARDAVDAVLGQEARRRPSGTDELPLVGAADTLERGALAARLGSGDGIAPEIVATLVDRYGTDAPGVIEAGRRDGLLQPLADGFPVLEAEIAWAVDAELALSLDDVLARRLRLAMELSDRGAAVAGRVAAIMGGRLGWDAERQGREVDAYLATAEREYGVPGPGEGAETAPPGDARPVAPAAGAPSDPPPPGAPLA
jgi:glycerol-3-phosphate dehydrogenase